PLHACATATSQDAIRPSSASEFNDAGDIQIVAANRVELHDASISTESNLTGGGDIDIHAGNEITPPRAAGDPPPAPADAAVRANVLGVGAQGGNVRLAAPVVALDGVGVVANAR